MYDEDDEDDTDEKTPEQQELENKFRATVEKYMPEIEEKLSAASKLIDEACAISEKHGIPFHGITNNVSDTYRPENIPDVSDDLIDELCGAYGEYEGWQHSGLC